MGRIGDALIIRLIEFFFAIMHIISFTLAGDRVR
jgi:hypothetical protein